MERDEIREEINSRPLTDFYPLEVSKGKNMYVCPLCGSGTGRHHTGAFSIFERNGRYYAKCFVCGAGGDTLKLLREIWNCSETEVFKNAGYNIEMLSKPSKSTLTDACSYDFTDYYRICRARLLQSPEAVSYLRARGISVETAQKYWIGFDPDSDPAGNPGNIKGNSVHPVPRIIVPSDKSFYFGRAIVEVDKSFTKMNPKGAASTLFNLKSLEADDVIFVVEGAFDALSVIEAGGQAVALNSTSNTDKFLSFLVSQKITSKKFVLCMDNDQAGKNAEGVLSSGLDKLGEHYITADISGECKDANENFVKNRELFIENIRNIVQNVEILLNNSLRPDGIRTYIESKMMSEVDELREYNDLKTGFENIDKIIGNLYPDLYVIGAISSLGKTTFCVQMADQIAAKDYDVLFFSLEQSRLEIISKCLSRRTAQNDMQTAVTSLSIRRGNFNKAVFNAVTDFENEIGNRLSVIEGSFENNISFIGDYVSQYIKKTGSKPVVFVDYLQILQPDDARSTTRETVDEIVKTLKQISRQEKITVFAISSLNRSNYQAPVDFESFKESGLIEYTAGVVWGLQLQVMNSALFSKDKGVVNKREVIQREKKANPRRVELICLKNRYGIANFSAYFDYYAMFDLYVPSEGRFYDENGNRTDIPLQKDEFFTAKSKKSVPQMEFIDPNTGEIVQEQKRKAGVAYKIKVK